MSGAPEPRRGEDAPHRPGAVWMIGTAYGEPFRSRLPLAVGDVFALLPGGLR